MGMSTSLMGEEGLRGLGDSFELRFSGRHEGLERLKHWVATNGALTLTLAKSARIACLEPHYFSATFRRHVGESFKQWRCRYRIAWIVREIARDRHSLQEICLRAGYRDRRAFERAVKRLTGSTPGRLRPPQ